MDLIFDATGIAPEQGAGGHPEGTFPFRISNAEAAPTKNNTGTMLVVTFETPSGSIKNYYNLWINSPAAVTIAKKEMSALCHAIGVFQLPNIPGYGLVSQNGAPQGQIIVGKQNPADPNNTYVEVKKVLDINGNEPGKAPKAAAPAQQAAPVQQPPAQQPQQWGTPPAAAPVAQPVGTPAVGAPAPVGFAPPAPTGAVVAAPVAPAAPATGWNPNQAAPGATPSWGPPR